MGEIHSNRAAPCFFKAYHGVDTKALIDFQFKAFSAINTINAKNPMHLNEVEL